MEEAIERIVGFFRHAAQGLEERKQILYLLGPVGGGKSSLAERLKSLMEVHPIYVLKAGDELSPVFESPLSLFDPESLGPMIEEKYGIPRRRLHGPMSPWCYKRLEAFGGDISRSGRQNPALALAADRGRETEPGDENNQDISSLVGKVDIRRLRPSPRTTLMPIAIPAAESLQPGRPRIRRDVQAPIKMLHRC
jgi:serine protein kinase